MTRKTAILIVSLVTVVFTLALSSLAAAPAPKKLKVKLNYTGAGTVDEQHKIYVLLFDADPFVSPKIEDASSAATQPAAAEGVCHIIRRQSASSKNGTIAFDDLTTSPVYAAAFFDKNASYNPQTFMIEGAPMGVYGKEANKAEAIKLAEGKPTEIALAFDDSIKAP